MPLVTFQERTMPCVQENPHLMQENTFSIREYIVRSLASPLPPSTILSLALMQGNTHSTHERESEGLLTVNDEEDTFYTRIHILDKRAHSTSHASSPTTNLSSDLQENTFCYTSLCIECAPEVITMPFLPLHILDKRTHSTSHARSHHHAFSPTTHSRQENTF